MNVHRNNNNDPLYYSLRHKNVLRNAFHLRLAPFVFDYQLVHVDVAKQRRIRIEIRRKWTLSDERGVDKRQLDTDKPCVTE